MEIYLSLKDVFQINLYICAMIAFILLILCLFKLYKSLCNLNNMMERADDATRFAEEKCVQASKILTKTIKNKAGKIKEETIDD